MAETKSIKVILITGRSIDQGKTREERKLSDEYLKAAAVCELDPQDMERLGLRGGETVLVKTDYGSVRVRAVLSTQHPHPGVAFIPMGPWANQVIGPETDTMGTPSYKSVPAEIIPAMGETVSDVRTLLLEMSRRIAKA